MTRNKGGYKHIKPYRVRKPLQSFAFRRPFCTPEGGLVIAESVQQAQALVLYAYGHVSDLLIYDPTDDTETRLREFPPEPDEEEAP